MKNPAKRDTGQRPLCKFPYNYKRIPKGDRIIPERHVDENIGETGLIQEVSLWNRIVLRLKINYNCLDSVLNNPACDLALALETGGSGIEEWKQLIDPVFLRIALNYLILFICIAGFRGGGLTALILPALQVCLSWINYFYSKKWQTVLMLGVHLLAATVLGLCFEGYLYLKYVSDDVESVLVFQEILKIGAVLAFSFGAITTLLKYLLADRKRK